MHAPDQTKLTASTYPLRIRPFSVPCRSSFYVHAHTPFHTLLWVANPPGQSWNLYSYVHNNPLNAIDPTGNETCEDGTDADACVPGGSPDPVPIDPCFYCGYIPGGSSGGSTNQIPPMPPLPQAQVFGLNGGNSSYNNCVAGFGAAGGAVGLGLSYVGTAGGGSFFGPEGTAAGLVLERLGVAALGTTAGQKGGQLLGSIVCSASSGGGAGSGGGRSTAGNMQKQVERGQGGPRDGTRSS